MISCDSWTDEAKPSFAETRTIEAMKAIVYQKSGSATVLKLAEIEKPVPKDDQVLIKLRAASVNPFDYHLLKHTFLRRVVGKGGTAQPGRDMAGEVEAIGPGVAQLQPGDEVFGASAGAFAEYTCAPASEVAIKPPRISFEQAAAIPIAGLTALQGLRDKGQLQPGQKVLINGASGGVGTFAVQIAKWLGAEVTGVCSTRNVDLVRSLGADHVVDYTRENLTSTGRKYDLFFDLVANQSFAARRGLLTAKGMYIGAGLLGKPLSVGLLAGGIAELLKAAFVSQKFSSFVAKLNREDLATIAALIEEGSVTPVIDKRYSLSETPEAVNYVEQKHARGKVIIDLDRSPSLQPQATLRGEN